MILRAVELDRRRAMIGAAAQVFKLLALTPPGLYQRLIRLGTRIRL